MKTTIVTAPATTSSFNSRIREFLNTTRVGIDFGEVAGGIAVVKGNQILHAETFVDFHDATLETRRRLRRGRRTRHAKKMRLARLRSWVLRQEIPSSIPGGRSKNGKTFLPDPYEILKDRKFWPQGGVYQTSNKHPENAPSWIDLAKEGKVDARGFVRALTLVFKKRGYKYDDQDLEELKDERLEEFLSSCAMLSEAGEMKNTLERVVNERGNAKFINAFQAALTRKPEPRKALPRQIKENDLRQIIEEFGKRYQLEPKLVARWQLNLAGGIDAKGKRHYGLLNRVLRAARFDNRVKSGCSWCGKKTPRIKKLGIREKSLRAAVGNVRVYWNEFSKRTRPLSENEKKPFLEWYSNRVAGANLSKSPKAITERAPSRKNIEKYLEQIRAVKRPIRNSKGKWRLGFPMLSQLDDLINRTPKRGRAKLCAEHLETASQGGFLCNRHPDRICKLDRDNQTHIPLDQVKIDPGRRKAPNPKREQRDWRVLKQLENILFTKNETGEKAWRYGPISFITLEIPEPQTERPKKGQETERKVDTLRERLHKETGGKCVYCGKETPVEQTELDHIVPNARGGPDAQINRIASCHTCNHPDTGKGEKLPSEWLSGEKWDEFAERVKTLKLPEFKEQLLLLEKGQGFPDDPTSLARIGGRTGAFVYALQELFKKHGVEIPTTTYMTGKPHIQIVSGRWTSDLRRSWRFKDKIAQQPNFPEKDRSDLYNHAQDAALLAATPPHTWRNRIFTEQAVRPCIVRKNDGRPRFELRERPGVALLSLAPDWITFVQKNNAPLVRVLGNFSVSWKRSLLKETLWQKPQILDEPKLVSFSPIRDIKVKQIREIISEPHRKKLETIAKELGLNPLNKKDGEKTIPEESLKKEFPKLRRLKVRSQKPSAVVVSIKPKDGPVRKQVADPKVASEGAVVWKVAQKKRLKIGISVLRPSAFRKFNVPRFAPPIPGNATQVGKLKRGEILKLDGSYYRAKEFSENNVTLIPENAATDALAKAMNIPKEERKTPPERKLSAKALCSYFEAAEQKENESKKPISKQPPPA